jgi:hypothetical protein
MKSKYCVSTGKNKIVRQLEDADERIILPANLISVEKLRLVTTDELQCRYTVIDFVHYLECV